MVDQWLIIMNQWRIGWGTMACSAFSHLWRMDCWFCHFINHSYWLKRKRCVQGIFPKPFFKKYIFGFQIQARCLWPYVSLLLSMIVFSLHCFTPREAHLFCLQFVAKWRQKVLSDAVIGITSQRVMEWQPPVKGSNFWIDVFSWKRFKIALVALPKLRKIL